MNPVRTFAMLALGAMGVASTAGAAPITPDPYSIFAQAREYWMQQRYPQLLAYTIAVTVDEGGKERVEHYNADYDAVKNVVTVDPVSDYELAHPVHVSGIGVSLLMFRLTKPLPAVDFLGVPQLAPTYSFGMAPFVPAPAPTPFNSAALVAQIRKEFHDPNPRATPLPSDSPNDGLRQIAAVVARNRDYSIALLGTGTIDGHDCYHLALTPLRDPNKFRIRQAWIDEQTYAPWQLLDALNFVSGPGTNVPWIIHFSDVDGAHVISAEEAQSPMAVSGEIYTKTSIQFQNVHAVDAPTVRGQIMESVGNPLVEPAFPGGNGE
jgi:hypothetical protein